MGLVGCHHVHANVRYRLKIRILAVQPRKLVLYGRPDAELKAALDEEGLPYIAVLDYRKAWFQNHQRRDAQ